MIPVMRYLRTVLGPSGVRWTAMVVAYAIASHCEMNGDSSASVRQLARECRMTAKTVVRRIAELEQAGVLAVDRRFGDTNRYRFPVASAVELVPNRDTSRSRGYRAGTARLPAKTVVPQSRADRATSESRVGDVVAAGAEAPRPTLEEARALVAAGRRQALAELGIVNL